MFDRRRLATAAGWTSLAALGLLGLGGAAATPDGWLLGWPSAPSVILLAAGLALLGLIDGGARGIAACAGLGLLPVLVSFGAPIPGLAALTGPVLLALLLAGVVVVLSRSRWRPDPRLLFPVVLAVYAGAAARVQLQVGPQGDEPHYLMVADSLLRDRDVSLEQDYAVGRYKTFFGSPLEPHYRVRGKHGEIFSIHALGLSLLVLPAYALGGYPAASLFMALLGALLVLQIRGLLHSARAGSGLAEGLAWAVALSPPLIHYAGLIFTEVPAALVVAFALHRGLDPKGWKPWEALAVGSALGFLPWLNVRYAPVAVILLLFVLWARPRLAHAARVMGVAALSALALGAYHLMLYGFFDPRRVYGKRPELSFSTLPEGLQGLLLDQEFGLFAYAPLFALAVPGMIVLVRRRPRLGLSALALVGVVVLTAGSWHMWRGGWNPPARFLVPVVPALALAVSGWLRRGLGAGGGLLVGWSLLWGLAGAWEPQLVHRDRDETAPLFRTFSGAEEWTRLLPAYVLTEPDRHRLAAVWAVALGAAVLRLRRRPAGTAGLITASTGLLLATGLASTLSDAQTAGRDAVRLVGRPALEVPAARLLGAADARWGTEVLPWGPAYEPRLEPSGVPLGARLELPVGAYRLWIEADEPPSVRPPALLEVRREGSASRPRVTSFERHPEGFVAELSVVPGDRAVTLWMKGGGPFLVRGFRLVRVAPGGLESAEGQKERT